MSLPPYIEEVRAIPVDDRLSDDAIAALMPIHLSLMTVIVANGLEALYGSAAPHREAVERLFALCRKRTAGRQSLARRSRLVPVMYGAFCMPDTVFDSRKYAACLNRSCRMAEEWRERSASGRPLDEAARRIEYGVLQSVLDGSLYTDEAERLTDRDFLALKQRIEAWLSELEADGSWSALSDDETARRLDLMAGYGQLVRDPRCEAQTGQVLCRCFGRLAGSRKVDPQTLFTLYRACAWQPAGPARQQAEALADRAARELESAADPDERLWHMAVVIDREALRIHNEIKRKMLAYSA